MIRSDFVLGFGLVAMLTGGAAALASDAAAQSSPLAGPEVRESAERTPQHAAMSPSSAAAALLSVDFAGNAVPLEIRPEAAALEHLPLSDTERAAAQGVLESRAVILDRLIREHTGLLLRAQTARASGDTPEGRSVMKELLIAFEPLGAEGSLEDQLARTMTEPHAESFRAMLDAYWEALASSQSSTPARVKLEALGQEIRRHAERTVSDGRARIQEVVDELGLTPEQESKVTTILIDFAQKTQRSPTRWQQLKLAFDLSRQLDSKQRKQLFKMLKEQRK